MCFAVASSIRFPLILSSHSVLLVRSACSSVVAPAVPSSFQLRSEGRCGHARGGVSGGHPPRWFNVLLLATRRARDVAASGPRRLLRRSSDTTLVFKLSPSTKAWKPAMETPALFHSKLSAPIELFARSSSPSAAKPSAWMALPRRSRERTRSS